MACASGSTDTIQLQYITVQNAIRPDPSLVRNTRSVETFRPLDLVTDPLQIFIKVGFSFGLNVGQLKALHRSTSHGTASAKLSHGACVLCRPDTWLWRKRHCYYRSTVSVLNLQTEVRTEEVECVQECYCLIQVCVSVWCRSILAVCLCVSHSVFYHKADYIFMVPIIHISRAMTVIT